MGNLRSKYNNNINKDMELIVRSQTHKSQAKNLDDCYERIQKILYECSIVHPERSEEPYEIPPEHNEKRLMDKKRRSEIKKHRGKDWVY